MAVDQALNGLEPDAGAAATADQLLARVAGRRSDDVTVVVLRRLAPDGAAAKPDGAGPAAAAPASSPERRGRVEEPSVASAALFAVRAPPPTAPAPC